ncbi:protein TRACHEARY ELEMENT DIFFERENTIATION-RELATED 7A-like [Penaeus chinensis]|uniref:protein TRACHEARY ELEMENT DIFFERENTIATION-RELATED 7A-like n=1 Tax=Penaeus chinensis TaxID=139456 RepID=UPI001FB59347|nr:protein TRACHEARY ELEMENT DIFFERENTIATION-RELATED 7A-like [Penaeus chinensis]
MSSSAQAFQQRENIRPRKEQDYETASALASQRHRVPFTKTSASLTLSPSLRPATPRLALLLERKCSVTPLGTLARQPEWHFPQSTRSHTSIPHILSRSHTGRLAPRPASSHSQPPPTPTFPTNCPTPTVAPSHSPAPQDPHTRSPHKTPTHDPHTRPPYKTPRTRPRHKLPPTARRHGSPSKIVLNPPPTHKANHGPPLP